MQHESCSVIGLWVVVGAVQVYFRHDSCGVTTVCLMQVADLATKRLGEHMTILAVKG